MECKAVGNQVKISGNIKSTSHFQTIFTEIESLLKNNIKELDIYILDSISLTSSVIGYFSKLVYSNNIDLKIFVSDPQLYELLEDLGLIDVLKVKQL